MHFTAAGHKSRFPYLSTRICDLKPEERKRLIARLEEESEDIRHKFACLTTETMKCLKRLNIEVNEIRLFFENCNIKDLGSSTKPDDSVGEIMLRATQGNYWNFFNYKLLGSLINAFCEGKVNLQEYEKQFKCYCERRIFEVPDDILKDDSIASINSKCIFCLKMDETFSVADALIKVERLQERLARLLNLEYLNVIDIEKGCVKLTFRFFTDFDSTFPLSPKQITELQNIGVELLECYSYVISVKDELLSLPGHGPKMVQGCGNKRPSLDSFSHELQSKALINKVGLNAILTSSRHSHTNL